MCDSYRPIYIVEIIYSELYYRFIGKQPSFGHFDLNNEFQVIMK